MARVRICQGCEHHNQPSESYCVNCGLDLAGLPHTETDQIDDPASPEPETTANPLSAFISGNDVEVFLEFPWGEVMINGRLAIGRDDTFSPIAHQLLKYSKVSRVHAEIWLHDNKLYLRHLGSSFPTAVNGKPYYKDDVTSIKKGDVLHFSPQVSAIIKESDS